MNQPPKLQPDPAPGQILQTEMEIVNRHHEEVRSSTAARACSRKGNFYMQVRLTTPLTRQELAPLHAGDTVLLTGTVYTAAMPPTPV